MGASANYSKSQSASGSNPVTIMRNYAKFLPQFSQLNLDQIGKLTGQIGQSGLDAVRGAGSDIVRTLSGLSNEVLPSLGLASRAGEAGLKSIDTAAADAARANANAQSVIEAANKGLGAINLGGLSPGEAAAVERSLNQNNVGTGNMGLMNPMNTIANAMNFGGAFNNKLGLYNNAVNTLGNAANTATGAAGLSSGISGPFGNIGNMANNTTSANTGAITGFNSIANPSQFGTTAALGFGNLLGQVATGNRSDASSMSMGGGVSSCCFIFMEAYHGKMPKDVRRARDKYYRQQPHIATGYKKMAKWLVPLMQKSNIVRNIVWNLMINPATKHCVHPMNNWNKRISHFWLRVWAMYGKI